MRSSLKKDTIFSDLRGQLGWCFFGFGGEKTLRIRSFFIRFSCLSIKIDGLSIVILNSSSIIFYLASRENKMADFLFQNAHL